MSYMYILAQFGFFRLWLEVTSVNSKYYGYPHQRNYAILKFKWAFSHMYNVQYMTAFLYRIIHFQLLISRDFTKICKQIKLIQLQLSHKFIKYINAPLLMTFRRDLKTVLVRSSLDLH